MVDGAALATAQLGDVVVDQSVIEDGRFTLVAPDDYRGHTLDIRLFGAADDELACESLYDDEDDSGSDSDSESAGRSRRLSLADAIRGRRTHKAYGPEPRSTARTLDELLRPGALRAQPPPDEPVALSASSAPAALERG